VIDRCARTSFYTACDLIVRVQSAQGTCTHCTRAAAAAAAAAVADDDCDA